MRAFLQQRLPQAALFLLLPALAVVGWGELAPAGAVAELNYWDKGLHFLAYSGLSAMACVALKADRRVVTATVLLALFGAVLEMAQGFTGRDPDILDECANTLGAITGVAIGWLVLRLIGLKPLAERVLS
jgi:VanZ family protein